MKFGVQKVKNPQDRFSLGGGRVGSAGLKDERSAHVQRDIAVRCNVQQHRHQNGRPWPHRGGQDSKAGSIGQE